MPCTCNTNCEKCGHKCHCDEECMECANDVCTGCECECTK
jgi:hypothetical protein